MPFLLVLGSQPLPAPMSDDTTATWTLGSPPGSALSALMKAGKFRRRLACDFSIDDESSTRNRRSTSRLAVRTIEPVCVGSAFSDGASRLRAVQAYSAGAA